MFEEELKDETLREKKLPYFAGYIFLVAEGYSIERLLKDYRRLDREHILLNESIVF